VRAVVPLSDSLEVGEEVNRKLIRPTLAEVKGRDTAPAADAAPPQRERAEGAARAGGERPERFERGERFERSSGDRPRERSYAPRPTGGGSRDSGPAQTAAAQGRKRIPPAETNAEIFYYKKQMDAHTLMVIVLKDGEEVEGTIEWYDRNALKVNRRGAPNILLLKHNIKYMFKAEDRDGGDEE
jgi:sRNA-binding regulator protein Hfq